VPATKASPTLTSLLQNAGLTEYVTTADTYACPLKYELIDVATNLPYVGTLVTFDTTTGEMKYNDAVLDKIGKDFKIKITTTYDTDFVLYTNQFHISNRCLEYTTSAIPPLWTFCLPVTPPEPAPVPLFDASTYFAGGGSDLSVCPIDY